MIQGTASLWRQIVQDYERIRREQEEVWRSLSPEESAQLTGELLLLLQEVERSEEQDPERLSMQEMLSRFKELLDELGAPYVIIGGLAAAILGVPRTTVDAAAVLLLPSEEAERLVQLIEGHGFQPEPKALSKLTEGRPAKFAFSRRFSLDVRLASFTLDREAIRRARTFSLLGHSLRFSSPEDLVVYKLARWVPLDQEDVRHILRRFGPSLDWPYIEEQVHQLSQEAGLPELPERWLSLREQIVND